MRAFSFTRSPKPGNFKTLRTLSPRGLSSNKKEAAPRKYRPQPLFKGIEFEAFKTGSGFFVLFFVCRRAVYHVMLYLRRKQKEGQRRPQTKDKKMTNANINIAAIKAKREEWAKAQAADARKYDGARLAQEWDRKDFACFIRRAPELAKLTTNELRALFLKDKCYDPATDSRLYTRYPNLYTWRRARKNTAPQYGIALAGLVGLVRRAEWERITKIWHNL